MEWAVCFFMLYCSATCGAFPIRRSLSRRTAPKSGHAGAGAVGPATGILHRGSRLLPGRFGIKIVRRTAGGALSIFAKVVIFGKSNKCLPKQKSPKNHRSFGESLEQMMGIEPTQPAWEAGVLPLNYICIFSEVILLYRCRAAVSTFWRGFFGRACGLLLQMPGCGIIKPSTIFCTHVDKIEAEGCRFDD